MAVAAHAVVLLTFLTFLWTSTGGDDHKTCDFNSSCVLPCRHGLDAAEVIHWHYVYPGQDIIVHSYYKREDHLEQQETSYKHRTSLVEDQHTKRRSFLQLKMVQVEDQGTYKCYTSNQSTFTNSFVNLQVKAPVDHVTISLNENGITCCSEGIYPEPELTWSTEPPSNVTPQDDPTVKKTREQLYDITSSLTVSHSHKNLSYSCNVSSRSNWKKITLRQYTFHEADGEIPCSASNMSSQSFGLTWRFNHSQVVVRRLLPDVVYNVSDEWKHHVRNVSESGNLFLQDLTAKQEGIYTCELRQAQNGLITENKIIIISHTAPRQYEATIVVTTIAVAGAATLLVGILGLVICLRRDRYSGYSSTNNPASQAAASQGSQQDDLIQQNQEHSTQF